MRKGQPLFALLCAFLCLGAAPYTYTYGQHLVDRALAQNPNVVILAVHAEPSPGMGNMILASNIGRIGKKADADDLRIVQTGKARLEFSKNGKRYSVEEPLLDEAGNVIGALGVSFAYQKGSDLSADRTVAARVQRFFRSRVENGAQLMAPYPALRVDGSMAIGGYHGDFDHFAADPQDNRLFLAGEDGSQLEVFDLRTGSLIARIDGFGAPHSPFIIAPHRVFVVDGAKPAQIRDTRTLALVRTIPLPPGADSAAYDPSTGHLWVVTGGKDVKRNDCTLVEIDPQTGRIFRRVRFDADHVEALAIESHGDRLYINVTAKNEMDVVNKRTGTIIARWPITAAQQNAPLAFDETDRRLFVVTRKPGMLLVLNADTGATIASFKAPERADQCVWDSVHRRIYVPGGDGHLAVYQQIDANHYVAVARIATEAAAKTGIFVPSVGRLYLASSPGDARVGGALLWLPSNR